MKMMDHCNVVQLKHCFYSTTEKDEVGHLGTLGVMLCDACLLCHGELSEELSETHALLWGSSNQQWHTLHWLCCLSDTAVWTLLRGPLQGRCMLLDCEPHLSCQLKDPACLSGVQNKDQKRPNHQLRLLGSQASCQWMLAEPYSFVHGSCHMGSAKGGQPHPFTSSALSAAWEPNVTYVICCLSCRSS